MSGGFEIRTGRPRRTSSGAGLVLLRFVILSTLCLTAVALAAAILAFVGFWTPAGAIVSLVIGVSTGVYVALVLPPPDPAWTRLHAGSLVTVAGAFTVWAGLTSSEEVVVRRDAASYFQTAIALTQWNSSPFAVDSIISAQGLLSIDGVQLGSPGFFQSGTLTQPLIEPQFLIGVTSWYSMGYWVGGATGMWITAALVGGLSILAVGTLVSLLMRPLAAVAATAITACAFPLLHVARSTYSEQFGLAIIMGGLSLLVIAITAEDEAVRARLGFVAGLILGGATLFRIDSLREAALVFPISAWLMVRHHAAGRPLVRGLGTGLLIGISVWLILSRNYIGINIGSVRPAFGLLLLSGVFSLSVVLAASKGVPLPARLASRLPLIIAAGVAACLVLLLSRPLWWVSRGMNEGATLGQRRQGIPVDPTLQYYENSLEWTAWWVGWPTIAVALAAGVYLTYRAASAVVEPGGSLAAWVAPFAVLLGSAVLVWTRPGINPDHPWADRRLVLLTPFVIALAAWLVFEAAEAIVKTGPQRLAITTGLALVATPVAAATSHHATDQIGAGTYQAITAGCDYFEPTDLVLTVDRVSSFYWPQTIRGLCEVPVVQVDYGLFLTEEGTSRAEQIQQEVQDRLADTPYTVVLLATDSSALESRSSRDPQMAHQLVDVRTTMNDSTVTVRPDDPQPAHWELWASRRSNDR